MNNPESQNKFVPKQALQPTPELYDMLVSDSMENLAIASLAQIPSISAGSVMHDNGCGTGAASKAVVKQLASTNADISIKATDINEKALEIYNEAAASGHWPAETSTQDSGKLQFPENSFSHSVLNALLFVLPDDGIGAVKEAYRTLKPGGIMLTNSWHYVPNMEPIHEAAKKTRPEGTPLPRAGMQKWEDPGFVKTVVEKGGFQKSNIKLVKAPVSCTTTELTHFATMLWSFIGGTGASGWLKSDEENWDEAIEIVKQEVRKTPGFNEIDGGKAQLEFVANIIIATK